MKKYKLFGWALIALTSFSACTNNTEEVLAQESEIKLTSEITPSRVTNQELQSTQIVPGQKVGVTITGAKSEHKNVAWTAGEDGVLTNTGDAVYYGDGTATITAYHPFNDDWDENTSYVFSVSTDQSENADYLNSDLLWATAASSKTDKAVGLIFAHKLAKVNVTLTSTDIKDLSDATISICGTNIATNFNPSTGELSAATANVQEIKAGVTIKEAYTASAIVVPQTVANGTKFIKVVHGSKTFYYTLAADKELKSGYSHNYTLTVKEQKVEVKTENDIVDWIDEGNSGDANEEELTTGLEGIHYTLAEEGNKNSTWTILTARGLEAFSNWVNGRDNEDPSSHLSTNAELGADIYMNEMTSWNPIKYSGNFDGKNYKIYGFKFEGTLDFGIFGYVKNATIKNITMVEPIVIYQNSSNSAFLAGLMQNSTMSNCHIIDGNITSRYNAAPLIATLTDSYIYDCTVKGTIVKGGNQTSGFIGQMSNSHIYRCGTEATIESQGEFVGIFTGHCSVDEEASGSIIGCYAKGKILQQGGWGTKVGGLVGASYGKPLYIGCYVNGTIIGNQHKGGLLGTNENNSTILACVYSDLGNSNIAGSIVGTNFATGYSSFLTMKYSTTSSNTSMIGRNIGANGYLQDITDENYIFGNNNNIGVDEIKYIVSSQDAQKIWDSHMPDKSYITDFNSEKKYNLSGIGENIEGSFWKKTNDGIALWWE